MRTLLLLSILFLCAPAHAQFGVFLRKILVGDTSAPPNYDTAYITTYKQHLTLSAVSNIVGAVSLAVRADGAVLLGGADRAGLLGGADGAILLGGADGAVLPGRADRAVLLGLTDQAIVGLVRAAGDAGGEREGQHREDGEGGGELHGVPSLGG